MATLDDDSVYKVDSCDDLELTLVQVAADVDARNNEEQREKVLDNAPESGPSEFNNEYDDERRKLKRKSRSHEEVEEISRPKYSRNQEGKVSRQENEDRGKLKRKYDESENVQADVGHAKVVATHYNALEEKGLDERSKSRVFYLRKFHNWIKSILINEYLTKIKDHKKHNEPIRALDMCCGKGGDLFKWRKGNITHLICSDIASVSLEQCKVRYQDMKTRNFRERGGTLFSTEYIVADCTKVRLREKYKDPSIELDIVSCQFAFHYCFESLPQAECMIKNASECLRPGGYFIGTTTDANELLTRVRNSQSNSFGNSVYNVIFDCDIEKPPLFGAKYHFYLDGSVDCPEFLVYFELFIKLARKYGLKLVRKEKFNDFYERMKVEGKTLLTTTKSLETYPAQHGAQLVGTDDDYEHAKLCWEKNGKNSRIGTLSRSEWEATSLYITFAFEKVRGTINEEGITVYDI